MGRHDLPEWPNTSGALVFERFEHVCWRQTGGFKSLTR